jgi:hypothetical protein
MCDKTKNSDVGVACGTYGGQEICIHGFGGESSRKNASWKT